MKELLLRTQRARELVGKRIGKVNAYEQHKHRWNIAAQRSINKEYADMSNKDKVNVLFGTFTEPLLVRLGKEKVDMTKISDEDFDRVYTNITKEMLQAYVDMKLNNLERRLG
jgi:hypothetical protein